MKYPETTHLKEGAHAILRALSRTLDPSSLEEQSLPVIEASSRAEFNTSLKSYREFVQQMHSAGLSNNFRLETSPLEESDKRYAYLVIPPEDIEPILKLTRRLDDQFGPEHHMKVQGEIRASKLEKRLG